MDPSSNWPATENRGHSTGNETGDLMSFGQLAQRNRPQSNSSQTNYTVYNHGIHQSRVKSGRLEELGSDARPTKRLRRDPDREPQALREFFGVFARASSPLLEEFNNCLQGLAEPGAFVRLVGNSDDSPSILGPNRGTGSNAFTTPDQDVLHPLDSNNAFTGQVTASRNSNLVSHNSVAYDHAEHSSGSTSVAQKGFPSHYGRINSSLAVPTPACPQNQPFQSHHLLYVQPPSYSPYPTGPFGSTPSDSHHGPQGADTLPHENMKHVSMESASSYSSRDSAWSMPTDRSSISTLGSDVSFTSMGPPQYAMSSASASNGQPRASFPANSIFDGSPKPSTGGRKSDRLYTRPQSAMSSAYSFSTPTPRPQSSFSVRGASSMLAEPSPVRNESIGSSENPRQRAASLATTPNEQITGPRPSVLPTAVSKKSAERFPCSFCTKDFTRKEGRARHEGTVHGSGEKYTCLLDTCHSSCDENCQERYHKKPFTCQRGRPEKLIAHLKEHQMHWEKKNILESWARSYIHHANGINGWLCGLCRKDLGRWEGQNKYRINDHFAQCDGRDDRLMSPVRENLRQDQAESVDSVAELTKSVKHLSTDDTNADGKLAHSRGEKALDAWG